MAAALFAASAAVGGAAAGATLGAIGAELTGEVRTGLASVASVAAVCAGIAEVSGRRLRLLQRDRETPRRWVEDGPLTWATRNGLALGAGFTSRIGFALWYVVPLAALLSGSMLRGALVYGLYGAARGVSSASLVGLLLLRPHANLGDRLLLHGTIARLLAGTVLVTVGCAVAVAVGV